MAQPLARRRTPPPERTACPPAAPPATCPRCTAPATAPPPATAAQPSPAPPPAAGHDACAAELRRLREEVAQLRRALDSRPVIDQARGYLMAVGRCSADDAWGALVEVSQRTNTKVRVVAGAVLATGGGTVLPEPLRAALRRALRARRR